MAYKNKPPNNQQGKNGDLVIGLDNGVNKLYGKVNDEWFSFGNGKKIGYRGKIDLSKSTSNDYIQNLYIARDLNLQHIKQIGSDTDKFLMSDNGVIKYVTGANLATYIGTPITALNNATANELVTVGATTTELDAESGLTFDGSTLKVESNNALASQLVLVDNGVVQGSFNVDSFGHLYIDANGGAAKISLDSQSGCVNFYKSTTQFGEINMGTSSTLKLLSASNYHINITSSGTGDVVLDSGGDIVIDSHDGNFIAKKAGTEFSAANSAYAGMILSYRTIGLNEAEASYNFTTSYAVPTDEFGITFVSPPSGNVEFIVQNIWVDMGGNGMGDVYAGLSTANATDGYSALGSFLEKNIVDNDGRFAESLQSISWTLTDLTPGTSYTYYVGFKSSSTTGTPHMSWGANAANGAPELIIKAIALPASIST